VAAPLSFLFPVYTLPVACGTEKAAGRHAGFWVSCSIRSTQGWFAGHCPRAAVTRFASGRWAANLPKSLEPTPVVGEHGTRKRELSISGRQLFVAYLVAFCLAGTVVWSFVRYWLFAP
jgi:hypothetical protein